MCGRAVAFLAVLLAAAACASPGSGAAARSWYAGDRDRARSQLEEQLADDEEGRALYLNELGVLALERRDLAEALRLFTEAGQIMGAFGGSGSDALGAIVGSEASKQWRGDPHERAMNSYYLGIVNYLLGVHDNALAGFKNAIFNDSGQGEDAYDCDFAPALFLEGLSYRQLADPDMAERSFAAARQLVPGCPALAQEPRGNVVVVVDVGRGPSKIAVGSNGEQTRFIADAASPAAIEVLADGALQGPTSKAGDLYFQATTRGGRDFDSILATKSAVKSGAQVAGIGALLIADDLPRKHQGGALLAGAALLLTSLAVDAKADTRHWTSLPNEVQLLRLELPPGTHEVEIRPSSGWRVAGPVTQTVIVPTQGDALVYQRVLR